MDIFDHVARRIPDDECALVGIDGPDASGKTIFANRLAGILERPVVRVSVDDFHHKREVRYQLGRDSPEGFWSHAFNYDRLRSDVIEPSRSSRRIRTKAHDLATDADLSPEPITAPEGAVIVVDGLFLHRDELRAVWDLTVFLDVPFAVTARRMAARDGTTEDQQRRYVEAQRIYFATCAPHDRATILIDNTDYDAPRLKRP